MDKPFNTQTSRRQTSFFVSAIAFLSIYIFSIEVTSLDDLGLSTKLRGEFVRTVLFWASVFLFLRYMLDLVSELIFFTWHRNWQGEASKWHRMLSMNYQIINLMKVPACEFTVGILGGYNDPGRQANDQVSNLCGRVQNILHNKNNSMSPEERETEAIRVVEDARLQVLSYSKSMYWRSLWQLFRLGIGIPPFIGYLFFDIVLPVAVFAAVFGVAYGDAEWIRYENLGWFWISNPE